MNHPVDIKQNLWDRASDILGDAYNPYSCAISRTRDDIFRPINNDVDLPLTGNVVDQMADDLEWAKKQNYLGEDPIVRPIGRIPWTSP